MVNRTFAADGDDESFDITSQDPSLAVQPAADVPAGVSYSKVTG